jgi:hypothetical protein
MSKSFRKTPITGFTTAESDKPFKETANRATRRDESVKLHSLKGLSLEDLEDEEFQEPDFLTEPSAANSFHSCKDGKLGYFENQRASATPEEKQQLLIAMRK